MRPGKRRSEGDLRDGLFVYKLKLQKSRPIHSIEFYITVIVRQLPNLAVFLTRHSGWGPTTNI